MIKRLFRPTNRRIRLLVGLLLAGFFCIQCTGIPVLDPSSSFIAVATPAPSASRSGRLDRIEKLAKTDHAALLEYCLKNYRRRYQDYTCTLIKQERIRGTLTKEQWIDVKFMGRPFSVAMKWTRNAPIGDRVLYVEGRYNNQMLVRPKNPLLQALTGGVVVRKPDSNDAMRNTLRPVNTFGFERNMHNLLDVYQQARQAGHLKEAFGGYADVAGRRAIVIVRLLPPKNDYPAHKTIICIDLEHLLPICVEGYNWDDKFSCRYVYKDLKFNVGLTGQDFLPENNDIRRIKK